MGDVTAIENLIDLLIAMRSLVEAKVWAEKALTLKSKLANLNLGRIAQLNGEVVTAQSFYRKAISENGSSTAEALLGGLLLSDGDLVEARKLLESAAQKKSPYAYFELARLHLESYEYETARSWAQKSWDAGFTRAAVLLSRAAEALGQDNISMQWLERGAERGELRSMKWLGLKLVALEKYEDSVVWFRRCVDAGDEEALDDLGLALSDLGHFREAVETLETAIANGNQFSRITLALVYRKASLWSKSQKTLLDALEVGMTEAYVHLGHHQEHVLENLAKAEEYYSKSVESGDSAGALSYGQLLVRLGRMQEAQDAFQAAITYGSHSDGHFELGMLKKEMQSHIEEIALHFRESAKAGNHRALQVLFDTFESLGLSNRSTELALECAIAGHRWAIERLITIQEQSGNSLEAEIWKKRLTNL